VHCRIYDAPQIEDSAHAWRCEFSEIETKCEEKHVDKDGITAMFRCDDHYL
jgi:hypothetical protein